MLHDADQARCKRFVGLGADLNSVLMSDAFVVVPGGIGTALETMMIWQLLQVGQLKDTPLILTGKMYQELVAWSRDYMLRPEFLLANPEDMDLPQCVDDGAEVIEIVRAHHARWLQAREENI